MMEVFVTFSNTLYWRPFVTEAGLGSQGFLPTEMYKEEDCDFSIPLHHQFSVFWKGIKSFYTYIS